MTDDELRAIEELIVAAKPTLAAENSSAYQQCDRCESLRSAARALLAEVRRLRQGNKRLSILLTAVQDCPPDCANAFCFEDILRALGYSHDRDGDVSLSRELQGAFDYGVSLIECARKQARP